MDTTEPGTFVFFYDVTDSSGNIATTRTRVVSIACCGCEDNEPPVITIIGKVWRW